ALAVGDLRVGSRAERGITTSGGAARATPGRWTLVDYEVSDREGDRASLLLRGELVGDVSSEQLKRELERHYVDDGVREIRADVGQLDSITLEGVAILL